METSEFVIGQRWVSHSDTALGLGIVTDISGRRVTLGFPAADEERTYAIDNAPLSRIVYQQGEEIETFDGERYTVRAVEDLDGVLVYHADDGEKDRQGDPFPGLAAHWDSDRVTSSVSSSSPRRTVTVMRSPTLRFSRIDR